MRSSADLTAPRSIVTVVPAHDERDLLPRCLDSIARAAERSPVPVTTIVVLDSCTDATRDAVPPWAHCIEIRRRNVGAARAAGFAASGACGRSDTWFSTTDADSAVPGTWFRDQLSYRHDHDAFVGTVDVDWTCRDVDTRRRYEAAYRARPSEVHGHVHGANLGLRADVYGQIGGFRPQRTGEDVDLVQRLTRAGARIAWDDSCRVLTSDRRDPRAEDGFGHHLSILEKVVVRPPGLAVETL